jgi:dUTP pyrophosphatase
MVEPIQLKVLDPEVLLYGIPSRESLGAAGYDLRASHEVIIEPNTASVIGTGIAIYIQDKNIAACLFPRSGLAAKHSLTLQNAVGLIDSDYQGELKVLLRNEGSKPYTVQVGDRIAQLVFVPVIHPMISVVSSFILSGRGSGGFGSTGIQSPSLSASPLLRPEGQITPTQLLGNPLPLEVGAEIETVVKYEPTGLELLEAEYGE